MRIGVLALQGDFSLHLSVLERVGLSGLPIRTAAELAHAEALIIPGGESTTIGMLMERFGLLEAVRERAEAGMPVMGTCAGAILMAQRILDSEQPRLELMPITVRRNAYGRQIESFEVAITEVDPSVGAPAQGLTGVFIRAPIIEDLGTACTVLATHEGNPVVVRYENFIAVTFHPELAGDPTLHRYFASLELTSGGKG